MMGPYGCGCNNQGIGQCGPCGGSGVGFLWIIIIIIIIFALFGGCWGRGFC